MAIDKTYYRIAPTGRAVCLDCPITWGCVHEVPYDVDRSLCPLEPDLSPTQKLADQWRQAVTPQGALRIGHAHLRILGEIEALVADRPMSFAELAESLGERSASTINRWAQLGVLIAQVRRIWIQDKMGRRRPIKTSFVLGVNWDILPEKEIE